MIRVETKDSKEKKTKYLGECEVYNEVFLGTDNNYYEIDIFYDEIENEHYCTGRKVDKKYWDLF